MEKLSKQEKAEARQQFENQLRYAFIKYDYVDDEEDNTENAIYRMHQSPYSNTPDLGRLLIPEEPQNPVNHKQIGFYKVLQYNI
ncbi:unnamed protein product [Colias eurytheme]|nr:unnamed protein product [Colias eurytheme]